MEWLRLARRLLLVSAFILASFVFVVTVAPVVGWLRGAAHEARFRARVLTLWSRGMARLLGMRISVRGDAPQPPFFLVTNHLSYTDVLLLASQAPCAFVAKAEIARWPVMGRLCRTVGTLFIERGRNRDIPRVLADLEAGLQGGVGLVLFPEATSSRGTGVLPFRPALLEAAARSRMPVSYASLTYRTPEDEPPADEVVCWWGDLAFGRHLLRLLRLREFEASVVFGSSTIRGDDRKELAVALKRAIEAAFEPVARDDAAR